MHVHAILMRMVLKSILVSFAVAWPGFQLVDLLIILKSYSRISSVTAHKFHSLENGPFSQSQLTFGEHSANIKRTLKVVSEQLPERVEPLAYQVVEMVGIYRCNTRVVSQKHILFVLQYSH